MDFVNFVEKGDWEIWRPVGEGEVGSGLCLGGRETNAWIVVGKQKATVG